MAWPTIHPGETVEVQFSVLGMSAAALARSIDVLAKRVSQTLTGRRSITTDTAVWLRYWLGTGPDRWFNLQRQYALRPIEQTDGNAFRSYIPHLARSAA